MEDSIIKGTGNSRYLKSIADFLTQYPTYQDFAAALAVGTLPVDFNGINEDGWAKIGTALNKANLLSDETCAQLGLLNTAVPDDAFMRLAITINMTKIGKGYVTVTVQLEDGTVVPNVMLSGVTDFDGNPVYTNENGVASGYIAEGNTTISVANCIDIAESPKTLTIAKGFFYEETLTVTTRNYVVIMKSGEWTLSGLRSDATVDFTAVGGGGGGTGFSGSSANNRGAGGGGGYVSTVLNVPVSKGDVFLVSIGAGGGATLCLSGTAHGGTGGITTVSKNETNIVSANGGFGGSASLSSGGGTGGAGNGKGGDSGANGAAGSGYIFNDNSLGQAGGGGGGGGGASATTGGSPSGAKGGYYYNTATFGSATAPGIGGGGGGGVKAGVSPSAGGTGAVYVRIK